MKDYVIPSDVLHHTAFKKNPERISWLVSILDEMDDDFSIRSSYRELALKFRTTRDIARKFVLNFFEQKDSRHTSDTPRTQFVLCSSISYDVSRHTSDTHRTQQVEKPTRKPSRKSADKASLVTRVREVFETYVLQHYEEPYYWKAKDAAAAKKLIEEIRYSRANRQVPLSVDDDGILEGFTGYINSITDQWVLEHFTMTQLHSSYQQIRQQLKAQNNVKHNRTSESQLAIQRQRESVFNGISEAQARWEQSHRKGSTQGG